MSEIKAAMVKELRERTGAGMMACKKALTAAAGDIEAAIVALRKSGEAKAAEKSGRVAAEGMVVVAISDDAKQAFIVEVNSETDFVSRDANFIEFVTHLAQRGLAEKVNDATQLADLTWDPTLDTSVEQARLALVNKIGENINIRRLSFVESTGTIGAYTHGDRIGALVSIDQIQNELAKDLAMHVAATNPQALSGDDLPKEFLEKEREVFVGQAKESGKPEAIIEKMISGRMAKVMKENSLLGQPFVKDPNQSITDLLKTKQATILEYIRLEVGEGIEKETVDFAEEVKAQLKKD